MRTACNADEALKLMEANAFDLLYTDNKMPGISGFELIHLVTQRWPKIKCILASGHLDDHIQQQVIERYKGRVLKKPYHMSDALRCVSELLRMGK